MAIQKGAWHFLIKSITISLILCFHACKCKKDDPSGDSVLPSINDPTPFRMNKINLLWEKAKKVVDTLISGLIDVPSLASFIRQALPEQDIRA